MLWLEYINWQLNSQTVVQKIIWTNAFLIVTGPSGTNFGEIIKKKYTLN